MKAKRKLTETYWAIRVGTFKNSKPYFRLADDRIMPQLFQSRAEAAMSKRQAIQGVGACYKQDWAVVRVQVREV